MSELDNQLRSALVTAVGEPPNDVTIAAVRRRVLRRRRFAVVTAIATTAVSVAAVTLLAVVVAGGSSQRGVDRTRPMHGLSSASVSPSPTATHSVVPPSRPGFAPVSVVTFVSASTGWMLGVKPCGSRECMAVRGTIDGGRSWQSAGLPASATNQVGPDGVRPVDGIRFADPNDGWLFDPRLFATHDGGRSWSAIRVPGPVTDLSVAGDRVLAVVRACPSRQRCAYRLYSATPASDRFARVNTVVDLPEDASAPAVAAYHGNGYVVTAGSHPQLWTESGGAWHRYSLPCGYSEAPPLLSAYSPDGLALASRFRDLVARHVP